MGTAGAGLQATVAAPGVTTLPGRKLSDYSQLLPGLLRADTPDPLKTKRAFLLFAGKPLSYVRGSAGVGRG